MKNWLTKPSTVAWAKKTGERLWRSFIGGAGAAYAIHPTLDLDVLRGAAGAGVVSLILCVLAKNVGDPSSPSFVHVEEPPHEG